jgi:hypothetical protein
VATVRAAVDKVSRFVFGYLSAAADFLFGYDFFISYAHRDGTQYPRLLRDRLEALGYRAFLDVHGYTGGDDLRAGTRRRIGMSKRLILLARPHALSSSRWVQLELEHFIALDRLPIVIQFSSASAMVPEGSPMATLLQERRSIREEATDLDGSPSNATIQELVRSFDATRQETVRLRALGAAAVLFIAIAIAAAWQWHAAVQERRVAEAQRGDAQATSKFIEASRLLAELDVETARRARLAAEIKQLSEAATAGGPASTLALRLDNLRSEIAETDKTMMQLADGAKKARRAGHEELFSADSTWRRAHSNPALVRQKPAVPRLFSFEILSVGFGESLILHYGDPDAPRFILIDGGDRPTYQRTLKPRLDALRERWYSKARLPIEYVMVSNQDNDRLGAFERMFQDLRDLQQRGVQSTLHIKNVWFESFVPPYPRWQKAVAREYIDQLGIPVNKPFDHLVMRRESGRITIDLGDCLLATVLGPSAEALKHLHEMWAVQAENKEMSPPDFPKEGFGSISNAWSECREAVATRSPAMSGNPAPMEEHTPCEDESVANRASLIILFEYAGRRFLHPGDSCAEDIEAGLRAAGLSGPDGTFHADVLLVPHLGSHRNANPAFFRRVTADQYLFTSNGKFGRPRDQTLQMILDGRRKDAGRRGKYVFQFLNRDGTEELGARLDRFFASRSSDEFGYRRIFRSTADTSIFIDLLERVRY